MAKKKKINEQTIQELFLEEKKPTKEKEKKGTSEKVKKIANTEKTEEPKQLGSSELDSTTTKGRKGKKNKEEKTKETILPKDKKQANKKNEVVDMSLIEAGEIKQAKKEISNDDVKPKRGRKPSVNDVKDEKRPLETKTPVSKSKKTTKNQIESKVIKPEEPSTIPNFSTRRGKVKTGESDPDIATAKAISEDIPNQIFDTPKEKKSRGRSKNENIDVDNLASLPSPLPKLSDRPIKNDRKNTAAKENILETESISLEKENVTSISPEIVKSDINPLIGETADISVTVSENDFNTVKDEVSVSINEEVASKTINVKFYVKYVTKFGQSLFLLGNHELFGNNDFSNAIPLQYISDGLWGTELSFSFGSFKSIVTYHYVLKTENGSVQYDWGYDKYFDVKEFNHEQIEIFDAWNNPGFTENAFYTEAFQNVLLVENLNNQDLHINPNHTHIFKVKAPLLKKTETLCILGNVNVLGQWSTESPILLNKAPNSYYFQCALDLSTVNTSLTYKYGVFDLENRKFVRFEDGSDRVIQKSKEGILTVVNDGFVVLPNTTWKGAGVSIPVFSLVSLNSFGVGEFADLDLLVDWVKKVGLKLIQILPVNDTSATNSDHDSYPYAAISAFALHPMYLRLERVVDPVYSDILDKIRNGRTQLPKGNLDYVKVNTLKNELLREIFALQGTETLDSEDFKSFLQENKSWLLPYAVFCHLKEFYNTPNTSKWPSYGNFSFNEAEQLAVNDEGAKENVSFTYFVQYHLYKQLKAAKAYANANGIILKGDLPIGIYKFSADVWQLPSLFKISQQAGAPPDDFAIKGQNWGFPTYNWAKMKEDGYGWWKLRFAHLSQYFDAFRIDHILGFFRIWSVPQESVEGIMGHFDPAVPVHIDEFKNRGIWFNYNRFVKPFINDSVVLYLFGNHAEYAKQNFLTYDGISNYSLNENIDTERKVDAFLSGWLNDDFTNAIRKGLYDLISNVLLFEAEGGDGKLYHFRFGIESTTSFQYLDGDTKNKLKDLYNNYYYQRQESIWTESALEKLPALKRSTDMLVFGEDLGLVPNCVPEIMKQLGILSLEIQRMPKDNKKEFFHPKDAPYLSVVTPSTHDMSTIRGWWEENKSSIQRFYNNELGQRGNAPYFCEPWINKLIIDQHLYSPAMWSIFQLQDLLGLNGNIRRENPHEERINVPSNPHQKWIFRMHIPIEELLENSEFNDELKGIIKNSGR